MSEPPAKHTSYYNLLAALQQANACALCEMHEARTSRYLQNLLYESVNDSGVRGALRSSHGFCRRHADVLLTFADGLGTSILYQDEVDDALALVLRLQQTSRKKARAHTLAKWRRHRPCPACTHEQRSEALVMGTLLAYLSDPDLRQALEESPGLCMAHFFDVIEAAQDPQDGEFLIELQRRKFSALAGDLRELIRKHDYRYADEESGREADAWARAIRLLRGEP